MQELTQSEVAQCPAFNAWQWGLEGNFPPYIEHDALPSELVELYLAKDVCYLVGQNDTCNEQREPGCVSHGLETTCMDMLEGWMRRIRAEQYFRYLNVFTGRPTHSLGIVPNSGHDHTLMFQNSVGLSAIFNPSSPSPQAPNKDKLGRAAILYVVLGLGLFLGITLLVYVQWGCISGWLGHEGHKRQRVQHYSMIMLGDEDEDADEEDALFAP